jgi:hypothetical protein
VIDYSVCEYRLGVASHQNFELKIYGMHGQTLKFFSSLKYPETMISARSFSAAEA